MTLKKTPPLSGRGKLINIDNGGTLTDICVVDGETVTRTKTLTTPHDLSACLFDGLKKASLAIYGKEDIVALMTSTDVIRYSTTQGTNALVERKGPRLGLICSQELNANMVSPAAGDSRQSDLFSTLVGERVVALKLGQSEEALNAAAVHAVTQLASEGANRIIVSMAGTAGIAAEKQLKRHLLRTFPPHLLGAVPLLFARELVDDNNDVRRTWTAIFNAFLHPAMERFLYNAEHVLRGHHVQKPLLIFRNDGRSGRVARTVAIKTYSSGPRGGMEGARALAAHYGFRRLLSMDVGGTTTDIGLVEDGTVRATPYGRVEGVETSFPLCDVVSAGVGGSSIIDVSSGRIKVGPESVGSAPGPACFGLGGTKATMTDAFLLSGLLDPASYFGGGLRINAENALRAIEEEVGKNLCISAFDAVRQMEDAWVNKIVESLRGYTTLQPQTTLAAFGGAGPFVACRVAQAAGLSQVVIPSLAAVFSAYGIGFSDIGHEFSEPLDSADAAGLMSARTKLLERTDRGMFAEGVSLKDCQVELSLKIVEGKDTRVIPLKEENWPTGVTSKARCTLSASAVKPMPHVKLRGIFGGKTQPAVASGTRDVLFPETQTPKGVERQTVPLYRVEKQAAGATASGPAVLEEAYFTCRIDAGWRFEINDAGDIMLNRIQETKS